MSDKRLTIRKRAPMAIIGIRDLVRGSKDILERVEEGQEPFVITRHGQPVAALVPIAPEDAERYLLAAAPEMIESRKRAEAAGTKRGRPLEEVAREYGLEDEPTEAPRRLRGFKITLGEN